MKILVIGDVHGRDNWKKAVAENEFDKVVFLGDYFDSWDKTAEEQIKNFNEIIDYAENSSDDVILLIGNHDYHYIINGEKYSGYQPFYADKFRELLLPQVLEQRLSVSHLDGRFLFTHAGLTETWLKSQGWEDVPTGLPIDEFLAVTFLNSFDTFRFNGVDNTGNDVTQGPFWVRPQSLIKDAWGDKDIIHVVGHTRQYGVEFHEPNVLLCDTDNKEHVIIDTEEETVTTLYDGS